MLPFGAFLMLCAVLVCEVLLYYWPVIEHEVANISFYAMHHPNQVYSHYMITEHATILNYIGTLLVAKNGNFIKQNSKWCVLKVTDGLVQ